MKKKELFTAVVIIDLTKATDFQILPPSNNTLEIRDALSQSFTTSKNDHEKTAI